MHGGRRARRRKSRKEPTRRGKAHKLFYERIDELGLLPLGLRRCNSVNYLTLMRINKKKTLRISIELRNCVDNFA